MELRHLRYFVAVAEALSFTKAAARLNTAQPSLTRQIKHLEDDVGVRLLNRSRPVVTLTKEGRAFLVDAKRILLLAAESIQSVRRLHGGDVRTLNVGYVSNLFCDLLPRTLTAFRKACPAITVNLFDMSCGDQLRALEDGRLHLGFVGLHEPFAARGFEFRTVASYRTVVALPRNNPLASKGSVELRGLAPMFFIAMSETSYPSYRYWLTKTCRRAGFTPRILQEVELERMMIHSIAAGLGVALVPEQLRKLPHCNVVFRPVKPTVAIEACVAWKGQHSSAPLQAYLEIVEHVGRGIH